MRSRCEIPFKALRDPPTPVLEEHYMEYVRARHAAMKDLFDAVPVGTPVTIFRKGLARERPVPGGERLIAVGEDSVDRRERPVPRRKRPVPGRETDLSHRGEARTCRGEGSPWPGEACTRCREDCTREGRDETRRGEAADRLGNEKRACLTARPGVCWAGSEDQVVVVVVGGSAAGAEAFSASVSTLGPGGLRRRLSGRR